MCCADVLPRVMGQWPFLWSDNVTLEELVMTRHLSAIVVFGVLCWAASLPAQEGPSVADLLEYRVPQPPPVGEREIEVGFEIAAPIGWATVLSASDGRLMIIGSGSVRYSEDGGRTWPAGEKLSVPVKYAIRLQSGKLAGLDGTKFYTSEDDGKTWTLLEEDVQGGNRGGPYPNTMIQTREGRLLLPTRHCNSGHQGLYDSSGSWGTLADKLCHIEGHAHFPEADIAYLCLSDDEGAHWYRSSGTILIWHDEGYGGMWPCDEPSIVDGRNGDVYMFMRTTLGRVYVAHSGETSYFSKDGSHIRTKPGIYFDYPQPTVLAGSYSPCAIRVVPKSGDWLIVWNQVSGDEIRAGYRRGRLSSAVSSDDGKTWKHFRTIDSVVLLPAGRVEPDPEPKMVRGLDYVGVLPEDYGSVSYPSLDIVDDTVFVAFYRSVVNPREGDVTGRRFRVLPLSWFYEDEPTLPPGPRLVVRVLAADRRSWNTYDVPSQFHTGRFFVHLRDLQTFLKSPIGRLGTNIYAPLHQVITCLGWVPKYDRSHLEDKDDPRMIVTCRHPHVAPPTEEIIEQSDANGDVWKYRSTSAFLGRMTKETAPDTYTYDRVGRYDQAQSFRLDRRARITAIEVFLDGGTGCKKGVTLALCKNADGMPSAELLAGGAVVKLAPFSGKGRFQPFVFAEPVDVFAHELVWIVLTKDDEPGENPMYNVPESGKDDAGQPHDWYPGGDAASRGPYKDADKPSQWNIHRQSDMYFRIITKTQ